MHACFTLRRTTIKDKNHPLKITQIISFNNQIFYSYQNGAITQHHINTIKKTKKKQSPSRHCFIQSSSLLYHIIRSAGRIIELTPIYKHKKLHLKSKPLPYYYLGCDVESIEDIEDVYFICINDSHVALNLVFGIEYFKQLLVYFAYT